MDALLGYGQNQKTLYPSSLALSDNMADWMSFSTWQVGEDKPPPPSPATEAGAGGVSQGFAVPTTEEELGDHGEASTTDVGIDGSVDPTFGSSAPRSSAGEKYARNNDHPHLAYIYRGRGPTREDEGVAGAYSTGGASDGKANVPEEESPDQGAVGPDIALGFCGTEATVVLSRYPYDHVMMLG